jgi:hypothetical protein
LSDDDSAVAALCESCAFEEYKLPLKSSLIIISLDEEE